MDAFVRAKDNPGQDRYKVLERVRLTLGAQKYLTDENVKTVFNTQKERMGAMLDDLDKAMMQHPRRVVDAQGNVVSYAPWKQQALRGDWNSFLDAKWNEAVAKNQKVVKTYTEALGAVHCSGVLANQADREFCERLGELRRQAADTRQFSKPW
jgi:hypothetical protein